MPDKGLNPWIAVLVVIIFLFFGFPFIYTAMNGSGTRHTDVTCTSSGNTVSCDSSVK